MLNADPAYVFADPFGRLDSGVSSYVANAINVLTTSGIPAGVVTRRSHEPIEAYRKRLSSAVLATRGAHRKVIVEAPESDAVTAEIPLGVAEIHVRLHCSRQLGAFMQGEQICTPSLELERREIRRAHHLSAPSHSAIIASRVLFDLPEEVCCYPNAAPPWAEVVRRHTDYEHAYILFVGRFHILKGAPWVLELAASMPDMRFLIAGPAGDRTRIRNAPPNLHFLEADARPKPDIYAQAKLIIIPSLYETASMVGIEALTAGRPLVAWSHLGIAEYAPAPLITLIEPYQLDSFAEAIRQGAEASQSIASTAQVAMTLNKRFLEGFHAVLNGSTGNFMPVALPAETAADISSQIRRLVGFPAMISPQKPRWRRKLDKLQRDPVRFIKDSWVVRLGTPPGKTGKLVLPLQATANVEVEHEQSARPAIIELTAPTFPKPNLITNISANGRIEFRQPPEKPEGFIAAFLYSADRKDEARDILEQLRVFDDFRYLQEPLLQVGTFADPKDANVIELVERIDIKNKKNVSTIDHILLLDPAPMLVEGLRSCGTRQRTIVILDSAETVAPDPWHTDVLIVIGEDHPVVMTQGWRRKIVVRERGQLALAIRRGIQEGTPKSPDVLLPILGFDGDHREELLSIDVRFHQGVIHAAPEKTPKGCSMTDIGRELARTMTGLAVTESVYLRYRSLCDRIDDIEARTQFLSYSLYDGVLFDVRA